MQSFYRKKTNGGYDLRYRQKKKTSSNGFGSLLKNGSAIFTIVSGLVLAVTLYYPYNQYTASLKPDIIMNDADAAMIAERYNTNGYIHYLFANDSIERR